MKACLRQLLNVTLKFTNQITSNLLLSAGRWEGDKFDSAFIPALWCSFFVAELIQDDCWSLSWKLLSCMVIVNVYCWEGSTPGQEDNLSTGFTAIVVNKILKFLTGIDLSHRNFAVDDCSCAPQSWKLNSLSLTLIISSFPNALFFVGINFLRIVKHQARTFLSWISYPSPFSSIFAFLCSSITECSISWWMELLNFPSVNFSL